ncbi:MAG: DUF6057 family protein [Tannerella sp.]|jgi:hypothetical protein|nr:DUF6057 family protein [Tannerella sp.]
MQFRGTNTVFYVALWLALSVFLQSVFRFHFYHIEQYRLFLYDGAYVFSTLGEIGGFCLLVYEFLVQFFIYPYAGALITSTLLTVAGILVHLLIKRMDRDSTLVYFFSFLTVCGLLFIHLDFNYFMQGTVAYMLVLLLLAVYVNLNVAWLKLTYTVAAIPVLFWAGGSVAILFALSVFVRELLSKPSRSWLFLIPCAEAFLLAFLSVRYAYVGEYRFAFLPDMFYHHSLTPGDFAIYAPWALLLLIITATTLLRPRKSWSGGKRTAGVVAQVALAGLTAVFGIKTYGDMRSLRYKEMEYRYRTKQFDEIIEMNRGSVSNYLYLCMLNLSLAEKGELADSLFRFDQKGPQSLMIPMNNSQTVAMLLSDIYYAIGHTGASQNMAFEANTSSPGHRTGRMLQRLVETNLIYGDYAVAEKYIGLLEKTFAYDGWAGEMRRYLYNDGEVNRNPEYARRRKSLPADNFLFATQVSDMELMSLSIQNPENRNPMEYTGVMYLLMKNPELFGQFLDRYYGTDVLPVLPLSFQEAVIILNESKGAEVWAEKGVSAPVIARFLQYKAFILANKNKPRLSDFVKSSFGDTYWYYYMFK